MGVRRELQDFLRTHDVQAIVAEFGHLGGNLAPLGNALGIPVFVYFRGFDASKRLRSPRIIRRYRAAIPRLAGVVSVSQSLLDNLAAVGVRHPNSVVIPTGVDTSVFVPPKKMTVATAASPTTSMNSLMKNIPNFMPEYSVR